MRVAWSRIPRVPLLFFLLLLAGPAYFMPTAAYAIAGGSAAVLGVLTAIAAYVERELTPQTTLEQWSANEDRRQTQQGCVGAVAFLLSLAPAWMTGWHLATEQLDLSLLVLRVVTAFPFAASHYLLQLVCLGLILDTRTPVVPPHLRGEAATRPHAAGIANAGDARQIAPGFVADVDPGGAPPAAAGSVVAAPMAPLKRVLRVPQVAAWKPASERRLRMRGWGSVLGPRFFAGFALVVMMIAGAFALGAWRGGGLAVLAALTVIAAASARATQWEWPGEVSLADWFRSERSLVNAQKGLGNTSNALVVGSGLVIAGEALWLKSTGRHDLLCGAPLVMIAASIALPLAWRSTFRRSIGQPPAVRSAPEPIRNAVLAVARRREEVISRTPVSEEISVVEEIAGVPVAPPSAEPDVPPSAPSTPAVVPPDGAVARETHERILAELSRAASLRADGAELVRRVERRLALAAPQPDDTDLLVEVAEVLFLAFPDRAEPLVSALGDLLAGPPPAKA